MKRDLRLLVQFNHKSGPDDVLETLQSRLPGAKRERESLVYRNNVLMFGKGVLAGHHGEFDYEISVFPLDQDPAFEIQRGLLKELRTAMLGAADTFEILVDDPELAQTVEDAGAGSDIRGR